MNNTGLVFDRGLQTRETHPTGAGSGYEEREQPSG